MRDCLPSATFDAWCETVSQLLKLYAGRVLADVAIPDGWLRVWYEYPVPAQIVAQALTTRCPPRPTLTRFYTDQRPKLERERLMRRLGLTEKSPAELSAERAAGV